MKNLSFKVEDELYNTFRTCSESNGHSMNYVLRAMMAAYADYEVSVLGGRVVPGTSPTSKFWAPAISSYASPKPKGRPPKPDETWRRIPGCTSSMQKAMIGVWESLPPKVQEAIIADSDEGWYKKCFGDGLMGPGSGDLCPLTEDTYIRKNGLAVSHKFIGDK